jgi:hypothetical protein
MLFLIAVVPFLPEALGAYILINDYYIPSATEMITFSPELGP